MSKPTHILIPIEFVENILEDFKLTCLTFIYK